MRALTILVAVILFQFDSYSQNYDSKLIFDACWLKNSAYKYKVTKARKEWTADTLARNDSTQYIATFEVIDSTEDSYKIKWSYEMLSSNKKMTKIDSLANKLRNFPVKDVVYTTDNFGAFVEVDDWVRIAEHVDSIYRQLIDAFDFKDENEKKSIENVFKPFLTVYTSRQGIEQSFLQEVQIFHFPFGIEMDINQPIEYEDFVPNLFGGSPLKADVKLFVEEVDVMNNYCVLRQKSELDAEGMRGMILKVLNNMGVEDEEMDETIKLSKFDTRDDSRYELFYYPGMPIKFETNRYIDVEVHNFKGKGLITNRIERIE